MDYGKVLKYKKICQNRIWNISKRWQKEPLPYLRGRTLLTFNIAFKLNHLLDDQRLPEYHEIEEDHFIDINLIGYKRKKKTRTSITRNLLKKGNLKRKLEIKNWDWNKVKIKMNIKSFQKNHSKIKRRHIFSSVCIWDWKFEKQKRKEEIKERNDSDCKIPIAILSFFHYFDMPFVERSLLKRSDLKINIIHRL